MSGRAGSEPAAFLASPRCGGFPVAYDSEVDLLAWTCPDGDLVTTHPSSARALARAPSQYLLWSYWVEEGPDGPSVVRYWPVGGPPQQGSYEGFLRRVDLRTGRSNEVQLRLPLTIGPTVTVAVNPWADCLILVARTSDLQDTVRVYSYSTSRRSGLVDLRLAPELQTALPQHVTNGVEAMNATVRCVRDAKGVAVVYVSGFDTKTDAHFFLDRIDASGAKRILRAEGLLVMAPPGPSAMIGAIDKADGQAYSITPGGQVTAWPPDPNFRWIVFDPETSAGVQVETGSRDGQSKTLRLFPPKAGAQLKIAGDGSLYAQGVATRSGDFILRAESPDRKSNYALIRATP